jgi:hypothetical protein
MLYIWRRPVGVDDKKFFSRMTGTGKHIPKKLFTFSHNSQNRHPFDTPLAFREAKAHFP